MTDQLKNKIQKNRDAFEVEPPEGHFERFHLRMEDKAAKKKWPAGRLYLEVAAVVLIILLAGNQARIYFGADDRKQEILSATLSSVSPEYSEVEFYYTSAINDGMSHWKKLCEQGVISPEDQEVMETEMREFDETYARLQNDLTANPDDERVINAMLEVYQSRLSIITLIINKLEAIKQQKKTNHEKEI